MARRVPCNRGRKRQETGREQYLEVTGVLQRHSKGQAEAGMPRAEERMVGGH